MQLSYLSVTAKMHTIIYKKIPQSLELRGTSGRTTATHSMRLCCHSNPIFPCFSYVPTVFYLIKERMAVAAEMPNVQDRSESKWSNHPYHH